MANNFYKELADTERTLRNNLGWSGTEVSGNSFYLELIALKAQIATLWNLIGIADGQAPKWNNSTKKFVPGDFAPLSHTHSYLAIASNLSDLGSASTARGNLGMGTTGAAGYFWAGPTGAGGAASFRAIAASDIPSLDTSKLISGTVPIVQGGTGLSALGSALQVLRVNSGATALEFYTPTTGTVASVALSLPAIFSVAGSPITANGTFTVTLAQQVARKFWAAPELADGVPTFRAIAFADLPAEVPSLNTSNTFAKAQRSAMVTLPITSGTVTVNPADSNDFLIELSTNATLVIQNGVPSDSFRITVVQAAVGGRVLSLPNGIKFQGGIAPTFSSAPGAIDKLFFDTHNGTVWCCTFANFG